MSSLITIKDNVSKKIFLILISLHEKNGYPLLKEIFKREEFKKNNHGILLWKGGGRMGSNSIKINEKHAFQIHFRPTFSTFLGMWVGQDRL